MASLPSSLHAEFLARRHFCSLDGVRCLAIVAVVWHHSRDTHVEFLSRGFLGVDLFFVLSGFLIVTLLLRERDARGNISLPAFYLRRSLRIFPLYYGLLLGLSLLYLLRPSSSGADTFFRELPIFASYTSNWFNVATTGLAITWSLAAEEQFYLVWPAVERWLQRSLVWVVLLLALLVNQAENFGLLDDAWRRVFGSEPDLEILDATFTPILLGVLLAHVLHTRRGFRILGALLQPRWASIALAAALLATVAASHGDISGLPRLTIQLLMTLWLASLVVREDHAFARPLAWTPVARLGAISYGMYLLHNFGIAAGQKLIDRLPALQFPGALFVLGLLCTVAIAEVSFRAYEQPFLRLKERFGRRA